MTVKQALKAKNKLVKRISEAYSRVQTYNSYNSEETRPYSAEEAYNDWVHLVDELIKLKADIHRANSKVYDKIFRLAELKSMAKQLSHLNCNSGKKTDYNKETTIYNVEIDILERDKRVKLFEAEIELLQEELDTHNAKTKI